MSATLLPLQETARLQVAVAEACRRISPLWPLQNFVAVNPFLGLSDMSFQQAAQLIDQVGHGAILMGSKYYIDQIRSGLITAQDIRVASGPDHLDSDVDPTTWLIEELQREERVQRILTVADWLDRTRGTSWSTFVVDEISKWCSSYFDRGQSTWRMPWSDLPLYQAWKRIAQIDANPNVFGINGFRSFVSQLPDSAEGAIQTALSLLHIPDELATDFLQRELMSVLGWSAYAAYQDRLDNAGVLPQLLAIRLAYDAALLPIAKGWQSIIFETASGSAFSRAKYIAQLASENAFRSRLLNKMQSVKPEAQAARPELQAVFCIDVRSEVYRRALESQSPGIATVGFAGFFGMPISVSSTARCPVLISPRYCVNEERYESSFSQLDHAAIASWNNLRNSASACFSFVEATGLCFGGLLLWQSSKTSGKPQPAPDLKYEIPLTDQIDLAAGALTNMSLNAAHLAPIVLLCGHGSRTENNPYAASLDCGACGGQKGDVNARFAAALLNDPDVRQGLLARGIAIPEDTVFIAGLHVTTTDEVVLFDSKNLSSQRRAHLESWLTSASKQARQERFPSLEAQELEREVQRRSVDWSEVRPEWGLAGNAAFIAAPRSYTRGLDLQGRVFLHDYDPASDQDGSVLQGILTAPVIVASWINLQYFGSTVNNPLFGSGNKVLHNVVGTFGVWEGNGGDLRTGLPMQSLHDGTKWIHEPLRLQVIVDAPRTRIDKILQHSAEIRNLVENAWIHLMAIEDSAFYTWRECSVWQPVS